LIPKRPTLEILQRITAPRRRLIVIGDIHGCFVELSQLLEEIDPGERDVVVSVGDMTRKGPDPVRCLELWQQRGYLAVRGNNEEKMLQLAKKPRVRRLTLGREDRTVLARGDLLEYIASWPLAIDVSAANIAVVHGGVYPGMSITEKALGRAADDVTRLRWIRRSNGDWRSVGKTQEKASDVLWAEVWDGPRTIVYGHTPLREPRIDPHAIGLDTGCVYGGWLTAAIYDGKWKFERVRAKKKYAD
jgi:bis(5'-nucleosyl)-tetraphosphatase (symmetrical)